MSLEDKYETLEKIGHGSFGIIRKVRRKTDGFVMCRKEISYLRMSQKEREQLHAEFQILSTLRHPHIVAYYHREHLKISQDLHLYMEYCGNGDLGRVIKTLAEKNQRAQESFVWSIFSQLVLALFRCHYGVDPPEVGSQVLGLTQGTVSSAPKVPAGTMTILHRDLKPENVFLGEDNSVKLGDFGLSKMIKSHDFASTYVGTPFYMSPEICAAEKYTLKSDIWALGCIIYELCAREPPFNAKTHYQLSQKIKEGKVAPLPDVYSAELNAVIKDCLKVNPDRRPDTAQLLNLPVVKLMRKEMEVAEFGKSLASRDQSLRAREEALKKKEDQLRKASTSLSGEKETMRAEIDASLRREWEVKARLEIDRLVKAEIEKLQGQFEAEVQARVQSEVGKKTVSFKETEQPPRAHTPEDNFTSSSSAKSDHPHSSVGTSGDEFPSTTDITEYSSMESPEPPREAPKQGTRTPFARAQTMYAGPVGTPMDIEMLSPSPAAIASLSLSPRRGGAVKAPTANPRNIFQVAKDNADKGDFASRWDEPREMGLVDSDDDDEIMPSPTRDIKSRMNHPFSTQNRPVLTSQKTAPVVLRTKKSNSGFISKQTGLVVAPASAAAGDRRDDSNSRSPGRYASKIPASTALNESPGLTRKGSNAKRNNAPEQDPGLGKVVAKNNMRGRTVVEGRTLVELTQARAGGRPLSEVIGAENSTSPKRTFKQRLGLEDRLYHEPVAVWDPEKDEMPSPFLTRQQRRGPMVRSEP